MKVIFLLLFLSLKAMAQAPDISVVSAERLNIVYRSVPNPVKIAVPGAKSFIATAPGLEMIDSIGNYTLTTSALYEATILIEATMCDGTNYTEKKIVRVKELPAVTGVLNGEALCKHCEYVLTKKELKESQVDVVMKDVWIFVPNDLYFGVHEYTAMITGKNGKHTTLLVIEGNKITDEVLRNIKDGSQVLISNIKFWSKLGANFMWKRASPIFITVKEDKL